MSDLCPCCGKPYAFRLTRHGDAHFTQSEFYRHTHYGTVYFHRIHPRPLVFKPAEEVSV